MLEDVPGLEECVCVLGDRQRESRLGSKNKFGFVKVQEPEWEAELWQKIMRDVYMNIVPVVVRQDFPKSVF